MIRKFIYSSLLLFSFVFLANSTASAAIEVVEFDNVNQEQRYRSLVAELRCLKCQNQNLASSDAPLAKDLRMISSDMIRSGASDQEIKDFMRERYGDFVLYEPPFNAQTAFLWLGPFVLLLIILISILVSVKKRQDRQRFAPTAANNESERAKVRNLLRDTPNLNSHYGDDSK
jgi:cytochrome c-type biogenesis protein CcmH